jgi:hypothetical protein
VVGSLVCSRTCESTLDPNGLALVNASRVADAMGAWLVGLSVVGSDNQHRGVVEQRVRRRVYHCVL